MLTVILTASTLFQRKNRPAVWHEARGQAAQDLLRPNSRRHSSGTYRDTDDICRQTRLVHTNHHASSPSCHFTFSEQDYSVASRLRNLEIILRALPSQPFKPSRRRSWPCRQQAFVHQPIRLTMRVGALLRYVVLPALKTSAVHDTRWQQSYYI